MILGFRRDVDEMCAFMRYSARTVVIITDVSGQPIDPIFKGQEVQEERLSSWTP
jgi:hypothetical protein